MHFRQRRHSTLGFLTRWRLRRLFPLGVLASAMAMTVGTATPALAAPPVYVDGNRADIDAIVRGSQVFVPVRGVFEKLGTAVIYTPPSSVVARKANTELARLTLGRRESIVNGASHMLSNAPFRSGSHIFVPLRLISQATGATVVYTAVPHVVQITAGRVVAAAPVLVAASPVAAEPVAQQQGLPWWVWLLIGFIILALLMGLLFRRRKPEPIISTRSISDLKIRTRQ